MHLFRHKQGLLTALVAALVLVLQSSVTVWATASAPADRMVDGWGNVLCITGMDEGSDNPATDHSGVPGCCALCCGIASADLAPPSKAHIAFPPPPVRSDALQGTPEDAVLRILDHDPAIPRAPPLTA